MIRGLYGIADAGASGDPVRMAAWMLEGGCRLIQVRCKGWPDDEVLVAAREVVARARRVGATVIVNDLPHVAVAAGAHGVHLGQADMDTASARRVVGPDLIIGRSTHSPEQAAAAVGDYVAFGPVYPTSNAPEKGHRGVDALASIQVGVPLVAIGGITAERLPEIRPLVDAWAVIGAIAGAQDPVAATRALL